MVLPLTTAGNAGQRIAKRDSRRLQPRLSFRLQTSPHTVAHDARPRKLFGAILFQVCQRTGAGFRRFMWLLRCQSPVIGASPVYPCWCPAWVPCTGFSTALLILAGFVSPHPIYHLNLAYDQPSRPAIGIAASAIFSPPAFRPREGYWSQALVHQITSSAGSPPTVIARSNKCQSGSVANWCSRSAGGALPPRMASSRRLISADSAGVACRLGRA